MNYNEDKLRALPNGILNKFETTNRGKLSCHDIECGRNNCPFYRYSQCSSETNAKIIEGEKLRRSTKNITSTDIYRKFLENLDLSQIESKSKKIPLMKMVRMFSTQFNPHISDDEFGLLQAKDLVESVFTPEQLNPVVICTDHTKWKAGDKIFTRDSANGTWRKSIFICYFEGKSYPYTVVDEDYEGTYEGCSFRTEVWKHAYKEIR